MALEAVSRVEGPTEHCRLGNGNEPEDRTHVRPWLPYHLVEPTVIIIDVVIVIATCVISGFGYNWVFLGQTAAIETYLAIGIIGSINLSAVLAARGEYRVFNLVNFYRQAREFLIVWGGIFFLLVGVAFLLKISEEVSRGATLTFFVLCPIFLLGWRRLLARFLGHALADGAFAPRRVIVIGERSRLLASRAIVEMRRCGYTPVRTFEIAQEGFVTGTVSERLRATMDTVIDVARQEPVAEILLLLNWQNSSTIDSITGILNVLPIPIYLLPDENVARFLVQRSIAVGATWAAEIQRAPLSRTEQFIKRCVDVVGAGAALLLLSPLMLMTALLIELDSPGPVLFRQNRNGFNGHQFLIVKFRTMYVLEDGEEIRQATRLDPRVTPLGRWLRRSNIDELPQLFNVLKGDMSLIGPRPHAVAHNTQFEKLVANYAFRHHVKPGITGWAQVNGYRGETPTPDVMAKRVECDLWYINNWSLWTDIRILFRTLIMGLQSSAY